MGKGKRILLVGSRGQLGSELLVRLSPTHEVYGVDQPDISLTQPVSIEEQFERFTPEIVINAAAYTDVDGAETNRQLAFAINDAGVSLLAHHARKKQARLIHFSTDYVFDGSLDRPYRESDEPAPLNVYGASKLAGEKSALAENSDTLVLRIAWLYGGEGKNFVRTILQAAHRRERERMEGKEIDPLMVVDDQKGTPCWTRDVAAQVETLLDHDLCGVVHATSEGECTWYTFAKLIRDAARIDIPILPCRTDQFPRPAIRPRYAVLENQCLRQVGLDRMPHFRKSVEEYVAGLEARENAWTH